MTHPANIYRDADILDEGVPTPQEPQVLPDGDAYGWQYYATAVLLYVACVALACALVP